VGDLEPAARLDDGGAGERGVVPVELDAVGRARVQLVDRARAAHVVDGRAAVGGAQRVLERAVDGHGAGGGGAEGVAQHGGVVRAVADLERGPGVDDGGAVVGVGAVEQQRAAAADGDAVGAGAVGDDAADG